MGGRDLPGGIRVLQEDLVLAVEGARLLVLPGVDGVGELGREGVHGAGCGRGLAEVVVGVGGGVGGGSQGQEEEGGAEVGGEEAHPFFGVGLAWFVVGFCCCLWLCGGVGRARGWVEGVWVWVWVRWVLGGGF